MSAPHLHTLGARETLLDETHDPDATSWIESANAPDADFPLQNLPYARARRTGSGESWRIVVAIGDDAVDLAVVAVDPNVPSALRAWLAPLARGDLNAFMAHGRPARVALRQWLFAALKADTPTPGSAAVVRRALVPRATLEFTRPCEIGDYTDFYTGIHHATAVGKLFRPDQPLLPNYPWVPIGYHGRVSSIGVDGQAFHRPWGQLRGADGVPTFAPCQRLDHELELGVFVGNGNAPGQPLTMDEADEAWFGLVLLNDWSARDVQAWEYQPLGPFLAKNFATTISPWIVTSEALAPFRVPFERPVGDPAPLPYLDSAGDRARGALDLTLEVWLQTSRMRASGHEGVRLMASNFRDAYWTVAQMLCHHASNGCNLQPGDLLGTGTQSGPGENQGGSLLELTKGGQRSIELPDGETRTFLEDGDTIGLRAYAGGDARSRRIGFGRCEGTVLPAIAWPGLGG
jgi:fumarylacetoacetase